MFDILIATLFVGPIKPIAYTRVIVLGYSKCFKCDVCVSGVAFTAKVIHANFSLKQLTFTFCSPTP